MQDALRGVMCRRARQEEGGTILYLLCGWRRGACFSFPPFGLVQDLFPQVFGCGIWFDLAALKFAETNLLV